MTQKSLLITFEGGEGSGKTTQSQILHDTLKEKGFEVTKTREPGGTKFAEIIREILVQGESNKIDNVSELFLFAAARADHVKKVIKEYLKNNKIVICDRFIDSTLAYQGYAGNIDLDIVRDVNKISIGEVYPDLTFILYIDPTKGIERALGENNKETRFEEKDIIYHNKIRDGYMNIARDNPHRCVVLNGTNDKEHISKKILELTLNKINE
jgi:dTMP kinase